MWTKWTKLLEIKSLWQSAIVCDSPCWSTIVWWVLCVRGPYSLICFIVKSSLTYIIQTNVFLVPFHSCSLTQMKIFFTCLSEFLMPRFFFVHILNCSLAHTNNFLFYIFGLAHSLTQRNLVHFQCTIVWWVLCVWGLYSPIYFIVKLSSTIERPNEIVDFTLLRGRCSQVRRCSV